LIWEFDPGSGWTLAAWIRHASRTGHLRVTSGERVSNTWVTNSRDGHNPSKDGLIPNSPPTIIWWEVKEKSALESARGLSASWQGNGLPRRWRVGDVRACSPTLALRHGLDSYGRQQSRILDNGGNPDPATPRARRSPSGCKELFWGKKFRLTVLQE